MRGEEMERRSPEENDTDNRQAWRRNGEVFTGVEVGTEVEVEVEKFTR